MDISEAIETRRSVRAFLDKPVEPELMRDIFERAQRAPSNCNAQPWYVTVVSGEARDKLEQVFLAQLMKDPTSQAVFPPGDGFFEGAHRERQIDCAVQLFTAAKVTREDKAGRMQLMAQNWRFFGAPHVAFLCMKTAMGETNAVDIGIYLQTLMLLMHEHGLASCPQGSLAYFPEPVFEIARIPEGYGIICGLSFGYEDKDSPLNSFPLGRATLDECVEFVG